MSQLVRLEGKHTAQRALCELLRPGTLHNEPQNALTPVPPVNKFTWRNEPKHIVRSSRSTIRPRVGRGGFTYTHTEGGVGATVS